QAVRHPVDPEEGDAGGIVIAADTVEQSHAGLTPERYKERSFRLPTRARRAVAHTPDIGPGVRRPRRCRWASRGPLSDDSGRLRCVLRPSHPHYGLAVQKIIHNFDTFGSSGE